MWRGGGSALLRQALPPRLPLPREVVLRGAATTRYSPTTCSSHAGRGRIWSSAARWIRPKPWVGRTRCRPSALAYPAVVRPLRGHRQGRVYVRSSSKQRSSTRGLLCLLWGERDPQAHCPLTLVVGGGHAPVANAFPTLVLPWRVLALPKEWTSEPPSLYRDVKHRAVPAERQAGHRGSRPL